LRGHLRRRDRRKKTAGKKAPCTTWQLVVEGERDADGKRAQHYRSFRGDKSDAEQALRDFIKEIETGIVGGDQLTVAEFIEKWLAHQGARTRPSTTARYRDLLEFLVIPKIGSRKLSQIRPIHIQQVYDMASKTGNRRTGGELAPKTIGQLHRVLSGALKRAYAWQLIATNPCAAASPPRSARREMRALDRDESLRLIDAASGTRLFVPIVLSIAVGFRRGELLALTWADVDFEQGTVSVSRTLNSDLSFGEPKTAAGRRTVGMPPTAMAALKSHRAKQNSERLRADYYDDQGLLFADPFGGPWKPDSITTLFRSICKRAGVGVLRWHDLRHTAASLMIAAGLPPTTVASTLGHANPGVTMSIYAHMLKGAEKAVATAMENVFQGIKTAG
jgi:integrase